MLKSRRKSKAASKPRETFAGLLQRKFRAFGYAFGADLWWPKIASLRHHLTLPGVILLALFAVGAFYRLRYASTFMTEYDDLGTIALNIQGHQYLINPYRYFHNIASGWTYPPGQYFIFSFLYMPFADISVQAGKLVAGNIDFHAMHTAARVFVGLCSIANMFLVWRILRSSLDRGRSSVSTLVCMSLLCLSFFHIGYSYHTGPYVAALTAMLLMLHLAMQSVYKTPKWIAFFVATAVLAHFNYLIFMMLPALFISVLYEICRVHGVGNFVRRHFLPQVFGGALFGLMIAHLFLVPYFFNTVYIKLNRGMHSAHLFSYGIEEAFFGFWRNLYAIFHNLFDVSYHLVAELEYLFYGPLFVLILIGVGVGVWRLIAPRHFRDKDSQNFIIIFLIGFAVTWVVMHGYKKLPFNETRHLIFWTPFYLVFLKLGFDAVLDRWFHIAKNAYIEWLLVPVVLFGITANLYVSERQAKISLTEVKALVEEYKPATMGMDLATLHTIPINHHFPDIYVNPQTGDNFADPNGMPNWPGFREQPYLYVGQSEPLKPAFIEMMENVHGKKLVHESIDAPEKDVYLAPNNTHLNSCRNARYIYVFE